MRLALEVTLDNAAFEHHNGFECARILDTLTERLRKNILEVGDRFCLVDRNGNTVGRAVIFER